MTPARDYFDMNAAPMRIGTVRLKVRDLETVSAFYQQVLGLVQVDTGDTRVVLGTGSTPLLDLRGDATLTPLDARQAGLFHTAFLMPSRADLARWLAHVMTMRLALLQGASDHIVSEAIYLADPEGNGIEVYGDRPVSRWHADGEIQMSTDPLDAQDLLKGADGTEWSGFPADGVIGHVHLQVGDTEAADRFYRDVLGLNIAARYPGASFYGSGGYHHQLAGNVWNSRRAGIRPEGMAGLDHVEIIVRDAADLAGIAARAGSAGIAITEHRDGGTLHDPWGTAITLRH